MSGTITQWDAGFALKIPSLISLRAAVMEVFVMMIPSVTCADRIVEFVSKRYGDFFFYSSEILELLKLKCCFDTVP